MKKNRLLALSMIACTLLAGCDEDTKVSFDENAKVGQVDEREAVLTVQNLYTRIKESNGGSVALDALLEMIARIEYTKNPNSKENVELKDSFANDDGSFNVKSYRTNAKFKEEIQERFETIIDGHAYDDENGDFDADSYKDYVEDSLNYDVAKGTSKYLDAEMQAKLVYDYDEYIEKDIIPEILQNYLYIDYLTGSSKYKGQFASQYAIKLEVLKIDYDTTSLNYQWNEALVSVVKNVTNGTSLNSSYKFKSSYDPSFVTFNSNNDLILYKVSQSDVKYEVYRHDNAANTAKIDALVGTLYNYNATSKRVAKVEYSTAESQAQSLVKDAEASWTFDHTTTPDSDFYKHVEEVLIARKLWAIDREVVLARNYDYKKVSTYYDAMTSSEQSEAETLSSTYSSSNSKPMNIVVKEKKIAAQKTSYYEEPEYYTKSNYSNVLSSTLSALRGTSAKDIQSHLLTFKDEDSKFLVNKSTVSNPVYLDSSGGYYYVCEVSEYYGYYLNENPLLTSSKSKSLVNYQIEAYQSGKAVNYKYDSENNTYVEDSTIEYASNQDKFESIIQLVQVSAENVLTDTIRKEAIVSLFEKYGLEINDQDAYDYIKTKYPDYFADDDD